MKTPSLFTLLIWILTFVAVKSVFATCDTGLCTGGPGMCPPPCFAFSAVTGSIVDVLIGGAVVGFWVFYFRRNKE